MLNYENCYGSIFFNRDISSKFMLTFNSMLCAPALRPVLYCAVLLITAIDVYEFVSLAHRLFAYCYMLFHSLVYIMVLSGYSLCISFLFYPHLCYVNLNILQSCLKIIIIISVYCYVFGLYSQISINDGFQ